MLWAGKAVYVAQYNISIFLQYFIFPRHEHEGYFKYFKLT